MKNSILPGLAILFFNIVGFSESKSLITNAGAIDTALKIIKAEDSFEFYTDELSDIALAYIRKGRRADAIAVFDLMQNIKRKTTTLTTVAHWYIKEGNFKEATFFLEKASTTNQHNIYGADVESSADIAEHFLSTGDLNRALREVELLDERGERASALTSIATAAASKNFTDAQSILIRAKEEIEDTEVTEFNTLTKAQIAELLAANGRSDDANKLIAEVETAYPTIDYSTTYPKKDAIKNLIIETNFKLKNYDKGFAMLEEGVNLNAVCDINTIAKAKLLNGFVKDGKDLLEKASILGAEDDYCLIQTIQLYLSINEDVFAHALAQRLTDERRFTAYSKIAEHYKNAGKIESVVLILNRMLLQLKDVKCRAKNYQDFYDLESRAIEVFDLSNEIKQFEIARSAMNLSHKTIFGAAEIADFAVVYKTKLSNKQIVKYVAQAYSILLKDESDITDIDDGRHHFRLWLHVANRFSQVGEKRKAVDVYHQILALIIKAELHDATDLNQALTAFEVSLHKSGLDNDAKMIASYKTIFKTWKTNN